jgi:hypothetical protein
MKPHPMAVGCMFVGGALVAAALASNLIAQQDEASPAVKPDVITTVAGGGPNGIPALKANIYNPWQIAVDKQGNIYFGAGGASSRVFKISPAGVLSVVAGNGFNGYSGDGGLAVDAMVGNPKGVAVDGADPANVYINDGMCLIRKIDQKTGIITTIAGIVTKPFKPTCVSSGDGGAAKDAGIVSGWDIVLNPRNNDLYFTEDGGLGGSNTGKVRRIAGGVPTGTISTVAGNESDCGGNAPQGVIATASNAFLCHPQSLALDSTVNPPNIFLDGWGDRVVRVVVGATGKMYTLEGGFVDPWQISVQVKGKTTTVTVPDFSNSDAGRIYQFTVTYSDNVPAAGPIKVFAGSGNGGLCGDGGPAIDACMDPVGFAPDNAGNWIVGDQAQFRIRKINGKTGIINSIEGWGPTPDTTVLFYSDPAGMKDVPATGISLYEPGTVNAFPAPAGEGDPAKSAEIYLGGFATPAVYEFNSVSGLASTLAGNGIPGFAGDGGAADSAKSELNYPTDVARDSKGNLYLVDQNNCAIRRVSKTTGEITTVAGGSAGHLNGCGYSGDSGSAVDAQLNLPTGIAMDAKGNLYIGEFRNCDIRKISLASGVITTFAGTHQCSYNGDGKLAIDTAFNQPVGLAFDAAGDLMVADRANSRLRKIAAGTNLVSTIAGCGSGGYNGDGAGSSHCFNALNRIAGDKNGNVFVTDQNNNILRWVDPSGWIQTFAGSVPGSPDGGHGFGGDGGPATSALMSQPTGITMDSEGNYYAVDYGNGRVRKVTNFGGYGRSTGSLTFASQQTGTTSGAQAVTLSAIGPVTIGSLAVPAGFKALNHCKEMTLALGETCTIDISFAPITSGTIKGTLTIASNAFFATQGNSVALTGTGVFPPAATPKISPGTGTYTGAQSVIITDTTPGAAIHYTTNGKTPVASSTVYTEAIAVSGSETIQAIAVATDYSESALASATYTLPAATPAFSIPAGTYPAARSVRITDRTPKAAIYYTIDGTMPTTSSTRYTKAIKVTANETISAIAVAADYTQSAEATAAYVIK